MTEVKQIRWAWLLAVCAALLSAAAAQNDGDAGYFLRLLRSLGL